MNIHLNKIVFPLIKQNLFTLSRVNPGEGHSWQTWLEERH